MRCLTFVFLVGSAAADYSEFTHNVKWMAHHAAWGAANERKYGKENADREQKWLEATAHLDAVKEALDDDTVGNLLNGMSRNAAWGAANERAWGKRSSCQVDWDNYKHDAAKLEGKLNNDAFASALSRMAFHASWWAANSEKFHASPDAQTDMESMNSAMKEAKEIAPKNWPMDEIMALFKSNALAAATERTVNRIEGSFMNSGDGKEDRRDWVNFEANVKALKTYLGTEEAELGDHLRNMAFNAAWGAVNERWYGKREQSTKAAWGYFTYHTEKAQALYKGPCTFSDIMHMMTSAAWGAANERAYGAKNQDAVRDWARFEELSAKVAAAGNDKKGEL